MLYLQGSCFERNCRVVSGGTIKLEAKKGFGVRILAWKFCSFDIRVDAAIVATATALSVSLAAEFGFVSVDQSR